MKRFILCLLAISAIVLSLDVLQMIYVEVRNTSIPFDTDEADHATPALELYHSIKTGSPAAVYKAVVRQAFYPPLHSFFVTSSYFLLGPSLFSSRIPSLVFFVFYLLTLSLSVFLFLRKKTTTPVEKFLAFGMTWVALALAVTSPISIYNASLSMLEIPGMFFVSLCLLLFAMMNNDRLIRLPSVILLCTAALLVFFTKYSFGIMTIPAVIAALSLIAMEKGMKRFLATGFIAAGFTLLILGAWTLITNRGAFFHFFVGHNSYAPLLSSENLLYELRAWLRSYCISPHIAGASLILGCFGFYTFYRTPAALFAGLNTVATLLILMLSTTNEERHFMVALPTLLFLSALGFYALLRPRWFPLSCLVLAFFLFTVGLQYSGRKENISIHLKSQFEGEPEFLSLFHFIYDNIDPSGPVIIYGNSDDFSIEALRWFIAKERKSAYTEVEVDAFPYRDDKNFTARKRMRNLDKPYKEKGFPKKPFERVLNTNYYVNAVHITNLSKKQRFLKEGRDLETVATPYLKNQMQAGSRLVKVYRFK